MCVSWLCTWFGPCNHSLSLTIMHLVCFCGDICLISMYSLDNPDPNNPSPSPNPSASFLCAACFGAHAGCSLVFFASCLSLRSVCSFFSTDVFTALLPRMHIYLRSLFVSFCFYLRLGCFPPQFEHTFWLFDTIFSNSLSQSLILFLCSFVLHFS